MVARSDVGNGAQLHRGTFEPATDQTYVFVDDNHNLASRSL